MRFTLAAAVEPSRPTGVTLTALAIGAVAVAAARTLAGQFHPQSALGFYYGGLVLGFEFYTVWSYWKGSHWARILVLIASFVIVAGEISKIFERDANLVELMSHPVLFLRFMLAAFLLYWLNTRPLRAWFKHANTAGELIGQRLIGRLCTAVERSGEAPQQEWRLAFEHDGELTLNCPWRIVLDDNLAFASNSSNGPAPESLPDQQQPAQLLENLRVKAVRIAPRTSDLFISFEMGIELQSWSIAPPAPAPAAGAASVAAYPPAPAAIEAKQWKFSDPTLTVIANSVGVHSQVIAARIPGEDADQYD